MLDLALQMRVGYFHWGPDSQGNHRVRLQKGYHHSRRGSPVTESSLRRGPDPDSKQRQRQKRKRCSEQDPMNIVRLEASYNFSADRRRRFQQLLLVSDSEECPPVNYHWEGFVHGCIDWGLPESERCLPGIDWEGRGGDLILRSGSTEGSKSLNC